jgi:hypothetical protein
MPSVRNHSKYSLSLKKNPLSKDLITRRLIYINCDPNTQQEQCNNTLYYQVFLSRLIPQLINTQFRALSTPQETS